MRARSGAMPRIVTTFAILALFSAASAPSTARDGVRWNVQSAVPRGGDSETARHVDRAELMSDVATLSSARFEGRAAGSRGAAAARDWLLTRFAAAGLTAGGADGFLQPFAVTSRSFRDVLPGGRPFRTDVRAANLVGRVPGRIPAAHAIVVTAHYDHLGVRNGTVYPGADDNASGVAVLLAAARHFSTQPPTHPMFFAALDAEEIGLRGARALLDSTLLPAGRLALNVNIDMASRSAAREIYAAGTSHTPWLRPLLEDVQRRASVTIRFGHDRPQSRSNPLEDWTSSSDHGPFHDAGVPFVYFGVEDHPDYHRPTDTADRIDPDFFGDVADMIVEALRTFDARLPSAAPGVLRD